MSEPPTFEREYRFAVLLQLISFWCMTKRVIIIQSCKGANKFALTLPCAYSVFCRACSPSFDAWLSHSQAFDALSHLQASDAPSRAFWASSCALRCLTSSDQSTFLSAWEQLTLHLPWREQHEQSLARDGLPLSFLTTDAMMTPATIATAAIITTISIGFIVIRWRKIGLPIGTYAFFLILSLPARSWKNFFTLILPLLSSTMSVMIAAQIAAKMKQVHHHAPMRYIIMDTM